MLFKKRDEWARPLAEFDVIKALPDSVTTHPLGLIEEREPKAGRARRMAKAELDLSAAIAAPLPGKPRAATRDAGVITALGWRLDN